MLRSDKKLFCYFSGYTEPCIRITNYQLDTKTGTMNVNGENLGIYEFNIGEYIQLDGLLFEVTKIKQTTFSASTTQELFDYSAFRSAFTTEKISLGLLAAHDKSHNDMWMLQPSASGRATYKGWSTLAGHEHTLKLDFEAPLQFAYSILEDKHLGLDGSSLTAREVKLADNLIKFSIYCGKDTREKTKFNQHLQPDTIVSITEPASIVKLM